jgi:hypothetical protein
MDKILFAVGLALHCHEIVQKELTEGFVFFCCCAHNHNSRCEVSSLRSIPPLSTSFCGDPRPPSPRASTPPDGRLYTSACFELASSPHVTVTSASCAFCACVSAAHGPTIARGSPPQPLPPSIVHDCCPLRQGNTCLLSLTFLASSLPPGPSRVSSPSFMYPLYSRH